MMPPDAQPIYFGPEERPLFGWLHRPARPGIAPVGVVLCSPFGYEAVCAHRSLRHFAIDSASAGVAALRFDYDGTGDSAGSDRDPDRVHRWIESVGHAVRFLRGHAANVCLLGVRLGALLAAFAAVERDDVAGLVAVVPVVSGKAYLRELKALQGTLGLSDAPAGTGPTDLQEAVGFALRPDTVESLSSLDLRKQDKAPAPQLLLLERDDFPGADAWVERLVGLGAAVERQRVPGYAEMMLDPHKTVVPRAMIRASTEWLLRCPSRSAEPVTPAASSSCARLGNGEPQLVETALHLDEARTLFGIQTVAEGTSPREGVLLLNAGSVPHIGPNRLYVELARRWAARGLFVLRFDLSGIGDSPARAGEEENVVYGERALEDIDLALDFLRRQGIEQARALGLCSGAYNAFKAAASGRPLAGVVLINPLVFFWKPGMSLDYPAHKVAYLADRYTRSALRWDAWKKILSGKVRLGPVAAVLARRAENVITNRTRDLARRVGRPFPEDLGAELEAAARRNVDLRFVFSAGDPGLGLLRDQGGSSVPKLRRQSKLTVEIIDGADHTFTPIWSQHMLVERLSALIEAQTSKTG